jgi:hypothetical protein
VLFTPRRSFLSSVMLRSHPESSVLVKLRMAAFLFKIAGRDPAFGRSMRVTFALAMVRKVAPYCLVAAGVAVILVAYNATG